MNTTRTFNRLFARLQLQAKLREIADAHSEAVMLELLAESLRIEFRYHNAKNTEKTVIK
jgi:hypothetical protein